MFQHPLRGTHSECLSPGLNFVKKFVPMFRFAGIETVLFSFEGSDPHVPVPDLLYDFGPG
jgi:hypothetical protein